MRAAQRSSSPSKEQVKSSAASKPAEPPRMLDAIEEVFSPLRSDTGRAGNLKLAPQDLPASKEVFAGELGDEVSPSALADASILSQSPSLVKLAPRLSARLILVEPRHLPTGSLNLPSPLILRRTFPPTRPSPSLSSTAVLVPAHRSQRRKLSHPPLLSDPTPSLVARPRPPFAPCRLP